MIQSVLRFLLCILFHVFASSAIGQPVTVTYNASTEDFANPERGFMQFTETSSTNYTPLDATGLAFWRTLNQPFGADYTIYSTLGYRGFYLESFTNGPISNAYLSAMQQDFDVAREAGVKFVVRFAYTHKDTPPFGDAPKNIVLQHIAQLKPILQANADVVAVLQMGFIGAWGEGYYTDHFGFGSLTEQNWEDRVEVLNALLDAMPPERSVQVRVPQTKQKAVYGVFALPNSAPLTITEAWENTPKARIGFANDCFLSSFDDQGTYENYDLNATGCDTCAFKPYFANDSQFVPVGGETCIDWDPFSDCVEQPGGGAQQEMSRMHFSYLNAGWNNAVNNEWVSGGCIEEIKQRLGYRLELQTAEYPTECRPGQTVSVKIDLKNKGFAAPFNPRLLRLLLRNTSDSTIWYVDLPDNPRSWLPTDQIHSIEHSLCLPMVMPAGNYELLLHLADPYPALSARPEYAIRLANENTWESGTGYNRLLHQITVNNTASLPLCSGSETCFQPVIPTGPTSDFTASLKSGCAPLTVTFLNQSSNCWSYNWFFPGGTPFNSTEPNPTVVYQNPGVFDVNMTATNDLGTSSVLESGFIVANPLPTVVIQPQGPISLPFGESVLLDGGPGFASWQWNTGETMQEIVVSDCGEYSVVVVDGNNCLATASAVTIRISPVITLDSGVLLSTPATAYQWLLNGIPIPGASDQAFIPAILGDYSVQVDCPGSGWVGSNIVSVQCNVTPCTVPVPSVDAQEACVLPNPAALNCYHGITSIDDVPVSFPPSWCTTIENNHSFAFKADSSTAVFRMCASACGPDGGIQAAVLSTIDCINFQFVSPCLGNITSDSCQDLVASNLTVGEVYYLMIDGFAGSVCDYTINEMNCPSGTTNNAVTSLQKLNVYPNPVSRNDHSVSVEINRASFDQVTFVVTNLVGIEFLRELKPNFSGKAVLEIGELQSGAYFLCAWEGGKLMATAIFLNQ